MKNTVALETKLVRKKKGPLWSVPRRMTVQDFGKDSCFLIGRWRLLREQMTYTTANRSRFRCKQNRIHQLLNTPEASLTAFVC